jgi:hypothetical protein
VLNVLLITLITCVLSVALVTFSHLRKHQAHRVVYTMSVCHYHSAVMKITHPAPHILKKRIGTKLGQLLSRRLEVP